MLKKDESQPRQSKSVNKQLRSSEEYGKPCLDKNLEKLKTDWWFLKEVGGGVGLNTGPNVLVVV